MNKETEARIEELQKKIDSLPGGSIAHKLIHGKLYYYHRTTVNGKRREKYVDEAEVPALRAKIMERRACIAELREIQGRSSAYVIPRTRIPRVRPVQSAEGYGAARGSAGDYGPDMEEEYMFQDEDLDTDTIAETVAETVAVADAVAYTAIMPEGTAANEAGAKKDKKDVQPAQPAETSQPSQPSQQAEPGTETAAGAQTEQEKSAGQKAKHAGSAAESAESAGRAAKEDTKEETATATGAAAGTVTDTAADTETAAGAGTDTGAQWNTKRAAQKEGQKEAQKETHKEGQKEAHKETQRESQKETESQKEAQREAAVPREPYIPEKYTTCIRTGEDLKRFAEPVKEYKKRVCYKALTDFVYGLSTDKVCILYGLRRTGKTTMMRQCIADMDDETFERTAFMQLTAADTLRDVDTDLRLLERRGYRYIFVDEVTSMQDFIQGAALFSDVYATCGMRIVLSGTSSLSFLFCKEEQLHDRCEFIHTTFIPYKDYLSVMGLATAEDVIHIGGTMCFAGENGKPVFADRKSVWQYVDTAIAKNIQNSITMYKGKSSKAMEELHRQDELVMTITTLSERDSVEYLMGVLIDECKEGSMNGIPDKMIEKLSKDLGKDDNLSDMADEVRHYLEMLDFMCTKETIVCQAGSGSEEYTTSQPGIRYTQVKDVLESLLSHEAFAGVTIEKRKKAAEKILAKVRKRMITDLILLETKMAYPDKKVFAFSYGEDRYDMVVADPATLTCKVYVVKHTDRITAKQRKLLTDEDMVKAAERRYGKITDRTVIYRGESGAVGSIAYVNLEEFLSSLYKD